MKYIILLLFICSHQISHGASTTEDEAKTHYSMLKPNGFLFPTDLEILKQSIQKVGNFFHDHESNIDLSIALAASQHQDPKLKIIWHENNSAQLIKITGTQSDSAPTAKGIYMQTGWQGPYYPVEKVGPPIKNKLFSHEKEVDELNTSLFDEVAKHFPVIWLDNDTPTDPSIIKRLTYYGYIFQEPWVLIDGNRKLYQYTASTNSSGPCMSMGVLNTDTGRRAVYHSNSPIAQFRMYLYVIDQVLESSPFSSLRIKLTVGMAHQGSLAAADALNKIMQQRLNSLKTQVCLYSYGKISNNNKNFYRKKILRENPAAGIAVFPEGIHILRDQDTLSTFPRLDSIPSYAFMPLGTKERNTLKIAMNEKKPDLASQEEWDHYIKMQSLTPLILSNGGINNESPIEGITISVEGPRFLSRPTDNRLIEIN